MIVRFEPNAATRPETMADLLRSLGGIPPNRVRMNPAPGTATEDDLEKAGKPVCELIDGTLVEKPMGTRESILGTYIASLVSQFVRQHRLGLVAGEAGYIRLGKRQVRSPDVTFIPWSSFPNRKVPEEAFWSVAPGLIVEVLSPSNRKAEIDRKLREFFERGCSLAWVIDPRKETAKVYTTVTQFTAYDSAGVLDGGSVLPGFTLSLADVFACDQPPIDGEGS